MLRRTPALLLLALACAPAARAASFDVATEYRMRPLAYKNLNLNSEISNDQSFISQRARVAFTLKDIGLGVSTTYFRCPVSNQPYSYDPATGKVTCPTHPDY